MASYLEQIQEALRQLENRVKSMDRRLSQIEDRVGVAHPKPKVEPKPVIEKERVITKKKFDWCLFELNIGIYLLQIIGVGIFLLGMAFLLKYSIEQGWLSPKVRIALGLIIATVAIGVSEWWRMHYKQWSLACVAGGIVLYYLSIYAAFNFYQLISLQQAFSGFVVVTVAGTFLAWWHDSLFIAWFSLLGGFLTPMILLQVTMEPSLLVIYLSLLALGFLILAYVKNWFSLVYGSLLCMMLYLPQIGFVGQLTENYNLFFIAVIWLIYTLIPYLNVLITKPKSRMFELIVIGISSISVFWALFNFLINEQNIAQAPVIINWLFMGLYPQEIFKYLSALFAVIYAALVGTLCAARSNNWYVLATLYSISVTSTVGFIITQWTGYQCCAVLVLFGFLLFATSFVCKISYMRFAPYLIWFSSWWYLFIIRFNDSSFDSLIWNEINISLATIFVSFSFAAYLCHQYKKQLLKEEFLVPVLLESVAILTVIYWLHTPIWQRPFHIIGLISYTLILFILDLFFDRKVMRQFSYVLCALAMVYFWWSYILHNLVNPHWALRLNGLFMTFVAVFASARCGLYFAKTKRDNKEYELVRICLDVLLSFFIFAWIRANIIIQFDELSMKGTLFANRLVGYSLKHDVLTRTGMTNVVLALFYTAYSVLIIAIGLVKQNRAIRYLGLAIIVLALKKLAEVIWEMPDTAHRIVAFLVVGALLIGASFLYQRMRTRELID